MSPQARNVTMIFTPQRLETHGSSVQQPGRQMGIGTTQHVAGFFT